MFKIILLLRSNVKFNAINYYQFSKFKQYYNIPLSSPKKQNSDKIHKIHRKI